MSPTHDLAQVIFKGYTRAHQTGKVYVPRMEDCTRAWPDAHFEAADSKARLAFYHLYGDWPASEGPF